MLVARAADVGMGDRRAVRGTLCDVPIELVVEDGADRSVGKRADLDGARGLWPLSSVRSSSVAVCMGLV
jgi:hypothetical protein